jgi:LAO/AO transport system kinase
MTSTSASHTMRKAAETMQNIDELATKLIDGDRRALSRAITLVESSRKDHRESALELIDLVGKANRQALRIGLSGTPGVGKSTFIESFGTFLIEQGLRVAVLAVDPSSARSGGSILGDKTRMDHLSRNPDAYIRPSPSQSHLGGVARRTRDAVTLCEASGFDVVLIETVGVGQSETIVSEMSDLFLLLLAPAGGDELQGVKRGIMEMADIILVNKADGDLKPTAIRTCADYAGALRLLRKRPQDPQGYPLAMTVSAIEEIGLADAWEKMTGLVDWRRQQGFFDRRRVEQAQFWFAEEVRQGLLATLEQGETRRQMAELATQVGQGVLTPARAAARILSVLKRRI